MSLVTVVLLLAVAAGVALMLVADQRDQPRLEWLGKPLASFAFVVAGWVWGAMDSVYGQLVLAGLIAGALGDLCLLRRGTGPLFLLGMVAFALGHLFYLVAFALQPLSMTALWFTAVLLLLGCALVLRWLMPTVPGPLKLPVLLYLTIIVWMVVVAVAASAGGATLAIAVGATGFAFSDLAVARQRFVAPGPVNRRWGAPLYFASQMLIASTVAAV